MTGVGWAGEGDGLDYKQRDRMATRRSKPDGARKVVGARSTSFAAQPAFELCGTPDGCATAWR